MDCTGIVEVALGGRGGGGSYQQPADIHIVNGQPEVDGLLEVQ